eukprot:283877-Prorocentrum_minimum.AAC.2
MDLLLEEVRTELIKSRSSGISRALTGGARLGCFFGVCEYLGGELNSPVVERRNKGLMAARRPNNLGESRILQWCSG